MNKNALTQSRFKTPHPHSLTPVSPRIDCRNEDGEWVLAGSGILFGCAGKHYVITAAHCIMEEADKEGSPHLPTDRLKIVLCINEEKEYPVVDVIKYLPEDEADFALLEVNFKQEDANEFNYNEQIRLIGSDIDTDNEPIAVLGHDISHHKGHHILTRCVSHSSYRVLDGFKAGDVSLEVIKGFSGGGLFIEYGNVLYCMGYVKEILKEGAVLEEIGVRHIPDMELPGIWMQKMPSDLPTFGSFGNNRAQQDYNEAWNALLNFLRDKEDDDEKYKHLLDDIDKARNQYPRPKSIDRQVQAERLLFDRHRNFPGSNEPKKDENWSELDMRAFAMVMRDRGTWPDLYGHIPGSFKNFRKVKFIRPLLQRAATLTGDMDLESEYPGTDTDEGIYEHIMRAAFSLDFEKMRKMVEGWKPAPEWMPKKVMLKSLWDASLIPFALNKNESILTSDLKELKGYIDSGEFDSEDKFVAAIIYNVCGIVYPFELKYREFNDAGLDSPNTVIQYIGDKIDKQKSEPIPYGIHISTIYGNTDIDSLPESLRILQFIINAGLLPYTNFGSIVNIEIWMKMFRHLFFHFPMAMVFYTLTYANEKLSRLCAQEMAFFNDEDFDKKKPEILLSVIKAICCNDTPPKFINGLQLMAIELFPTVEESIWASEFIHSVEKIIEEIRVENLSVRDTLSNYIGEGIVNIRSTSFKSLILKVILRVFDRNPLVLSHLLSWSMDFDNELMAETDVSETITGIVENLPLSATYELLQKINFKECLPDHLRMILNKKLATENFSFAKDDPEALRLLSYLIEDSQTAMLKEIILQSWEGNFWDCGISGNSFSSKGHLHLDLLADKIEYSDEELALIISNMRKNVDILKGDKCRMVSIPHIRQHSAELLIAMKRFLRRQDDKEYLKSYLKDDPLNTEIEKLIRAFSNSESTIEMIYSDEFHEVKNGIDILNVLIDKETIQTYEKEIGALISLATLKAKPGAEMAIGFISYLVNEFPEEMIARFGADLRLMLRKWVNFDYQELKVHAINVRRNLDSINIKLHQHKV